MAAAIKAEFGVESTLVEGSGGVFDVDVDGRRVFSKKEAGRFARDAEIVDLLRAQQPN